MGVVRREGDWRLEKQADGVYEVTHKQRPELKIITDDYEPTGIDDVRADFTIQVREVSSYSEAERVFEERASGSAHTGGIGIGAQEPSGGLSLGDDSDLPSLPPVGLLVVGVVGSVLLLRQSGFDTGSTLFVIGAALLFIPLAVVGLTYNVYRTDGPGAAVEFLIATDEDESSTSTNAGQGDQVKKTPRASEKTKEEIYFGRAEQRCEWCGERTDSPEVHHIKPRSEGGPNEYSNLIALCPGCHSKADKGGISRTKLRSKVSRQIDDWSGPE